MKKLGFSVAAAALIAASSAQSQTPQVRSEVGYHLWRTRVAANVHQVIRRCPTADRPEPYITTVVGVSDKAAADPNRFVRLDLSRGPLTGRNVRLGLRPDGTLSTFNASSTGEAGQVLSAIINVGTTLATLGSGGVPVAEGRLTCNADTLRRVERLSKVESDLAALRSQVANGDESPVAAQTLVDLTAELNELVEQLTLRASYALVPTFASPPATGPITPILRHIAPLDYGVWFAESGSALQRGLERARVVGQHGFLLSITPNADFYRTLNAGDGSPAPSGRVRRLYYQRPVPAAVTLVPCLGVASPRAPEGAPESRTCTPDATSSASAQKSSMLLQLSGHFSLPVGRRNLFGTRSTAVTFSEDGSPSSIEVGSTSGAADVATVLASANTGIATLRDADTAANTRRIAAIKAEQELAALLEAN